MAASISDPHHLATYSVSPSGSRTTPSVFSSFSILPDLANGWVTLTVQGDGIHIMDLVSSQPIASHTLGPSALFSAPAVTTIKPADGKAMRRRTYAPIVPSEVTPQARAHGQEIWIWEDDVAESLISSVPKKHTVKVPHSVVSLLPCSGGDIVIAVSPEGDLSSVGGLEKGVISAMQSTPSLRGYVLKCWVFPRRECRFPTTFAALDSSITVRLIRLEEHSLFLYLDACDATGTFIDGPRIPVPSQSNAIVDFTFSSNGGFSCLAPSGSWVYYQLGPRAVGSPELSLRPSGSPVTLLPNNKLSLTGASLIPLTSSHILLSSTSATVTTERAGKLALELQIWDLNYGVILTSFSAGLPGAMAVSEDPDGNILLPPQLRLTDTSMGHAILTISPSLVTAPQLPASAQPPDLKERPGETARQKKRSSANVLVVPYHVPQTSTLAAAVLSRSADTVKAVPFTNCVDDDTSVRKRQIAIVGALRSLVKEDASSAAVDAFWKWIDTESVVEQDAAAAEKGKPARPDRSRVDLPHKFVTEIVSILADAPSGSWATFRPIMEYLLVRRHAVVNSMLCRSPVRIENPGVVQMLSERGDWVLVKRSLFVLPDIPEDEVVRLLRMVVHSQLNSTAETMDIDSEVQRPETQNKMPNKPSWSDTPSIQDFLPAVLGYPLSGTPLRQAIRRRFADIEALLPVLQHIVKIMERRSIFDWMKAGQSIRMDRYGKVLRPRLHERNQRGKRVEKEGVTFSILRTQAGHPPLETMISFLEAVLDTSFLSLMQHSEGRTLIASLEGIIRPELELTFHLGNICALLEPFAKTRPQDKNDKPGDGDAGPKQREPAARRTRENAVAVQIYQVEELEL